MNNSLAINSYTITLPLKDPFGISRGTRREVTNLVIDIDSCRGEAAPIYYHGQRIDDMKSILDDIILPEGEISPGKGPWGVLKDKRLYDQSAIRAALDMALLDYWGKQKGKPLYTLWALDPKRIPISSFTLGLDEPEIMVEKAKRAPKTPILKVKLGGKNDLKCLEAIRASSDAKLRIDANEGWTLSQALEWTERLADMNVDLIEQPLPRDCHSDCRELIRKNRSGIPIILDESIQSFEDIDRTYGEGDGINIKLAKCGGPSEAKRMAEYARSKGLLILLGCMLESSLGITAAAHVAPLADFTDLDGAVLIAQDPFTGAQFNEGQLVLPDLPGLGVIPAVQKSV